MSRAAEIARLAIERHQRAGVDLEQSITMAVQQGMDEVAACHAPPAYRPKEMRCAIAYPGLVVGSVEYVREAARRFRQRELVRLGRDGIKAKRKAREQRQRTREAAQRRQKGAA